ncbi:EmrB/QacA subfamily drug resistance transporter [Pseudonocardia eucalypti]|uniref:DHA2 family efflux MFS transporter permease subunit n=1 Tax=Pseudonocardia eucalypti TaxID=648755 RepID=UPI00182632F5|nr:EmrB/QacA subfamily drug resistance transporter [Pseudonocardia eucalypti]
MTETTKLTRIGAVLLAAPILANLDATSVGVATEALAGSFRAPLSDVQWVSTGYLLALGMVMPVAGWAGDRFGAKRVWIFAVAAFTLGSMLCGLAWSLPSLIGFRLVQAIGGGLMNPVGQAILARVAGPSRIGRLMSMLSIPVAFAPAVGPILGGVLVHELGWRWIFFVNLPVCLVVLPLAARLVPAGEGTGDRAQRLDLLGLALLSPGMAALVYGLSSAADGGSPMAVWLPVAAGVALVVGYLVHGLRGKGVPLIDPRLFARRGFSSATGTAFLLGASLYSSMLLVPLYYQRATGAGVLAAGLLLAPQAVGAAFGALVAGRWSDRSGPRRVVQLGLGLAMLGTVPFALLGGGPFALLGSGPFALLGSGPAASVPAWLLSGALVLRGIGLGAVIGPNVAAVYTSVTREQASRAASAVTVVNRIGGSLGTAALTVLLQAELAASASPAAAFGHTFAWSLALTALAFLPAALLPRRQ